MDALLIDEIRGLREELRDCRSDVAGWRQEYGERLVAVETKIKPAIENNGQPSRLTVVENKIASLEKQWWKFSGGAVVLLAILNVGWEFAKSKLLGH